MQTHRRSLQHISDHEYTKEQINIKEGVGEVIVQRYQSLIFDFSALLSFSYKRYYLN